ncbi:TadE/TadG family type IV pilus assembly protein [Chloroflexota bacterium]
MEEINIPSQERGQSLVELAISMTVLLILLAGLVDLGRAFFTYITLRDAAQEGASYASVIKTEPLSGSDEVTAYCAGITDRVLITSKDLDGGVSNGPINLETLADAGEVTVQTHFNGTECTSMVAANLCKGRRVNVKVTYGSFPMTMPFMGAIIGSQTISLSAVVEDMILTPACQ